MASNFFKPSSRRLINSRFTLRLIFKSNVFSVDGKAITLFEQTPLMSTYLIAFVISDFKMNSKTKARNILFRAFSRPEQIDKTEFGLETAAKALELYEIAFDTRYELLKLDQVALPVFNRGGMENYGSIFYQEDYFLYEPSVSFSMFTLKSF